MKRTSKLSTKATSLVLCLALLMSMLVGFTPATATEASAASDSNAITLEIKWPSAGESTIAPYRDFYIIGKVKGGLLPGNADMTVMVAKQNGTSWEVVRELSTSMMTKYEDFDYKWFWEQVGNGYINTGIPKQSNQYIYQMLMPDFRIDNGDHNTLKNSWNKCAFNSDTFTAMILGSKYAGDYIGYTDRLGNPLIDLDAGQYLISVLFTEVDTGKYIASTTKEITLGVTANKVMSRFGPSSHLQKVLADARATGNRVYFDPFAGVLDPYYYITDWPKTVNGFTEVFTRWRRGDSLEYHEGQIKFFAYNVSDQTATYNAELGQIQQDQRVNAGIGSTVHYDIGEPSITTGGVARAGVFVPFANGDKLNLTRASVSKYNRQQNESELNINTLPDMTNYFDLNNTPISVPYIGEMSINGVVAPIQVDSTDVSYNPFLGWYDVNNRIASVKFNYYSGDMLVYTDATNVELTRTGGDYSKSSTSIFEFSHVIKPNYMGDIHGIIKVVLSGYDAHGVYVPGTVESFYLNIQ